MPTVERAVGRPAEHDEHGLRVFIVSPPCTQCHYGGLAAGGGLAGAMQTFQNILASSHRRESRNKISDRFANSNELQYIQYTSPCYSGHMHTRAHAPHPPAAAKTSPAHAAHANHQGTGKWSAVCVFLHELKMANQFAFAPLLFYIRSVMDPVYDPTGENVDSHPVVLPRDGQRCHRRHCGVRSSELGRALGQVRCGGSSAGPLARDPAFKRCVLCCARLNGAVARRVRLTPRD
eukprot:COSAG03_NODE_3755_length_1844_cov_24.395415_2_plen_234_part_00